MAEKSALNNLGKHKWEPGRLKSSKILRKDSVSTAGHYIMARYFFSPANPAYNIDSAYACTIKALDAYPHTPPRVRERLMKLPLDSTMLIRLRRQIDSVAFVRAGQANTEESYLYFIEHFPGAGQQARALYLRDEAAYQAALAENTYEAFNDFLRKYPGAHRAAEARTRYDKLLFEEKTGDKRMKSFEAFIKEYPQSPYRRQAEEQVFEIATAAGDIGGFREFLRKYPAGAGSRKAANILYYLAREAGTLGADAPLLSDDSLLAVRRLNDHYLVPYFEDGHFGFMDDEGREVIKASVPEIAPDYLCGNIQEDILVIQNKIRARNGAVIYSGKVDALDDLGVGFLAVTTDGCLRVIHKSGFDIGEPCLEDATLLSGRYVATLSEGQWSVYTLAGRLLVSSLEDIKEVHGAVAMKRHGKWSLVMPEQIGRVADRQTLSLAYDLDDIKAWPGQQIWIKQGEKEGLLASGLSMVVPPGKHTLDQVCTVVRIVSSAGVRVYHPRSGMSPWFQDMRVSCPWIGVKTGDGWHLVDTGTNTLLHDVYDSLSFSGPFAVGHYRDSMRVYLHKDRALDFGDAKPGFIPSKDSSSFLLVDHGEMKSVYDAKTGKLFDISCDRLEYGEGGVFIFTKKGKKGLVGRDGSMLLPAEYDAIGEVEKQWVPLLKKMKFGLFSPQEKKEIKPGYDKNLKWYNSELIRAFRDGQYGLIDRENKEKVPFEYEEIRYWNDSVAFVKKDAGWMLLDIVHGKVTMGGVRDYRLVRDTPFEKVAIVRHEEGYGVISSVRGTVIPNTFTDIVNVGSAEKPLYFTEKHVKEASIFVVIYYDEHGQLVRRQAIDSSDYDRIYCPD